MTPRDDSPQLILDRAVRAITSPGRYASAACAMREHTALVFSGKPPDPFKKTTLRDEKTVVLVAGRGVTNDQGQSEIVIVETKLPASVQPVFPPSEILTYLWLDPCLETDEHTGWGVVIGDDDPVVTVTPNSAAPALVTATATTLLVQATETPYGAFYYHDLKTADIADRSSHFDLKLNVYSWDVAGNPLPNTPFWWRCLASGVGFDIFV